VSPSPSIGHLAPMQTSTLRTWAWPIAVVLWLGLVWPASAAAELLYASLTDGTVASYDVTSGVPATIQASRSSYATGFTTPTGLAFDASGNLYVADYGTGANGTTVTKIAPGGGTGAVWGTGLSGPRGVAFDASGNLLVVNAGNSTISRIASTGGTASLWATGPGSANTMAALALDAQGRVYATVKSSNGVYRVSGAGGALTSWATGLSGPNGLAFDASGVLYVSNAGNGSAGNGSLSTVGVNGGAASSWVTGLNAPYGLAFDSSGSLYVANGSTISKFSSNGTLLFSFSTGTASPRFLAFDEVQPVPEPSAALSAGIAGVTALAAALRRRTAAS
jgi:sugar lactone lactonase YvrE